MQALILAGGPGKRMWPLTNLVPKPLLPINNKPFLVYQMNFLKRQGIENIILAIGHKGRLIKKCLGNGKNLGVQIVYSEEKFPLGTGGAIKQAENLIKNNCIFILNGDTFADVNLKKMLKFHQRNKQPITIAVVEVDNPGRFGQVKINNKNLIINFKEKTQRNQRSLINAGIYIFQKKILKKIPLNKKISLEKDIFPTLIGQIAAFRSKGYFIDIGIPKDYQKAKKELNQVAPLVSLKNRIYDKINKK